MRLILFVFYMHYIDHLGYTVLYGVAILFLQFPRCSLELIMDTVIVYQQLITCFQGMTRSDSPSILNVSLCQSSCKAYNLNKTKWLVAVPNKVSITSADKDSRVAGNYFPSGLVLHISDPAF